MIEKRNPIVTYAIVVFPYVSLLSLLTIFMNIG